MGYYSEKLSGARLRRCYEIAPPRVAQYLDAELEYVVSGLSARDAVLELGCGYGRAAFELAKAARRVVGIDTARENLTLANELAGEGSNCEFVEMDAVEMGFPNGAFELVACVQNGICAFNVDPAMLVREAFRVTKPGGTTLFSSYAERFWPHRLEWFEIQAKEGLLGEMDYRETGNGVIVCRDGFRAGAMGEIEFREICRGLDIEPEITEVDGSSIFFEMRKSL
jgi:2-polyprenyl-6-hydroxyphenyl methylase/3-demethylubiquinone-9 3-methyltransferase